MPHVRKSQGDKTAQKALRQSFNGPIPHNLNEITDRFGFEAVEDVMLGLRVNISVVQLFEHAFSANHAALVLAVHVFVRDAVEHDLHRMPILNAAVLAGKTSKKHRSGGNSSTV